MFGVVRVLRGGKEDGERGAVFGEVREMAPSAGVERRLLARLGVGLGGVVDDRLRGEVSHGVLYGPEEAGADGKVTDFIDLVI